jgi:hypothetical protein
LQKSSPDEELLPQEDRQILQRIDQFLVRWRITPPLLIE